MDLPTPPDNNNNNNNKDNDNEEKKNEMLIDNNKNYNLPKIPNAGKKEDWKAPPLPKESPFGQYYGQLIHQQNMLQDAIRTPTYQNAFNSNMDDFWNKTVLDVGTGSGILAYFAARAGAKKVYAIECSDMAFYAEKLIKENGFDDRIIIIKKRVEDITNEDIPERVDIIISEPLGFLLVHERMLESFIVARDNFLKPNGLMMPTTGTIFLSPFTDQALYEEQYQKADFWRSTDFYGLNLSSLYQQSINEYFSQPIVGYFNPNILLSTEKVEYTFDFRTTTLNELQSFDIPFEFTIQYSSLLHGIACWFDVLFLGSTQQVVLSTGPYTPGTHWYQCRLLLPEPIGVNYGQRISGFLKFRANEKFSYFIEMEVRLDGTEIVRKNSINLYDQQYHFLTNTESATSYGNENK